MSPAGQPTGRKSFVNHRGNLCSIEVAERMRERAREEARPQAIAALGAAMPLLRRNFTQLAKKYAGTPYETDAAYQQAQAQYETASDVLLKANGITA